MAGAGKLAGKVIVVTGSSSGIGAATAHMAAAEGASVVVNSSSSVEAGEKLAGDLPSAIYVQADIADEGQARGLIGAAVEHFGRLDALVNNAGRTELIPHGQIDAVSAEVWHRILSTNVIGTWAVSQAAVPHLRESPAGSIVNVSSVAGVRQTGSSIPYAVSKAGVNHMTRLLANVLGPEVRVNAVAPGLVDTPWTADWEAARASYGQRAPMRRSATAEDVADAVLYLTCSAYITGEIMLVDGGMHLR